MTATLWRLERLTTEMRLNKVASEGSIAQTFDGEEYHAHLHKVVCHRLDLD
jgi:hypothetical protein